MRGLLKSKLFWGLSAALILIAASGIYTVFSGISSSPLSYASAKLLTPLQSAVTSAWNGAENIYARFFDYDNVVAENEALRVQIASMERDIRETETVFEENARLRSLLNMRSRRTDLEIISAEIIASQSGSWGVAYTLDRGEEHGVSVGDCVMTHEGMAGYITRTGDRWSEMTTMIDTGMLAAAITVRTREAGVAEGEFTLMEHGLLKLSYLPRDCRIRTGDAVETSGKGGMLPKGILIGRVSEVRVEEHGISAYAVIKPAADLSRLGYVYIVTDFETTD